MPPIFPCWTNTVNEFFLSASPATKPAPWQVTLVWVAILVVDVLACGRAKSINKNVKDCKKKCAIVVQEEGLLLAGRRRQLQIAPGLDRIVLN